MLPFSLIILLWPLWLLLLGVWIIFGNKKHSGSNQAGSSMEDHAKDEQWQNYLLSFQDALKSTAEKNLLNALLNRKTADQLYVKAEAAGVTEPERQIVTAQTAIVQPMLASAQPMSSTQQQSQPLDNTLLLLYFGAFLLVASAGLFVAIGKFDGLIRTIILVITAITLYLGGLWLYKNNKKLTQAGISFIGTGMMIAPLSGVAWYNLVSHQHSGAIIWFATSVACALLYTHALSVVKNSFVAYLLIGSFVSSIESAVLAIALPSYVFAWAMIAVGLLLQVGGLWRTQSKNLVDASDISAQLLVPLSVAGSVLLLPHLGSDQLAVSLLLAAGYYALLAWQRPIQRGNYSIAAQLSAITALANISYSIRESFLVVGLVIGILCVLYMAMIAVMRREIIKEHYLVLVSATMSSTSIILAIPSARTLLICVTISLALSTTIWLKLRSKEALFASGLLLVTLPFLAGQYAVHPHASPGLQLALCCLPVIIIGALAVETCKKADFKDYYVTSSALYLLSAALLLGTAWFVSFLSLLTVCLLLAVSFAVLQYVSKERRWWIISGSIMLAPIVYAVSTYGIHDPLFSAALSVALAANVAISLTTREQVIRWFVVGCILISPIALGGGGFGIHWGAAGYAGGYLIAMAACVLARAIARGKLLVSSKVPIGSYDTAASQAYVVGYSSAGALAIIISLFDSNSRLVTTLVLGIISLTVLYVAHRIESNNQVLVLLPILSQAMLFSGLRPELSNPLRVGTSALLSSVLALVLYASVERYTDTSKKTHDQLLQVCVITSYLGSALVVFNSGYSPSRLLPVALALAGCLTIYHNRRAEQITKELSLGVIIGSAHWFLYLLGVHNVHVHAHLLALFLAGFALWRNNLGDRKGSAAYVQTLFGIATIPMVLQALDGQSGTSYGLLLIIQQVSFMLIGVFLNQRFLLRAGMWVALGAILYQLRGLGWAFLTLLAAILIGVAIYRLQKHGDNQHKT